MIYVALFLLLLLSGAVSVRQRKLRRVLYQVCLIALFFFVAFRFEVGCDWTGYEIIYQIQGASTIESALDNRDPLFWAAIGMLHLWRLDYPYINVIAAAVYFFGFHMLARRQPDPLGVLILSFPLLVLHLAMSGIRQAMAVGILCMAFNAFSDRKLISYVGFVLLAAGFHTSALVFLSLTPFVMGNMSAVRLVAGAAIAFPSLFLLALGEHFTIYQSRYVGTSAEAFGAAYRTGLVSIVGFLFLLFARQRWKVQFQHDYDLVYVSALLMVALLPTVLYSSVIADRMSYYLMPLQFVIVTKLPLLFASNHLLHAAPYAVAAATLFTWISFSALFELCYLPYESWLF